MGDTVEFTSEPAPEVLRYFRGKGLKPSFDWRDVWADEHATAFTVAKATKLDVLETLRQAVDDALAKGETFESFRANLTPKLKALGWWGKKDIIDPKTGQEIPAQLGSPRRLKTIYDANIRSAFAAGVWERAQRTKATRPFFAYRLGPSIVHRPTHLAREGMVYPVDHPIWDTWFPPNGWGCKCWVWQITREEAESFGYRDDMPEPLIQTRGYINKRTGELEQIPIGIDPGWHNNPGKFRAENLRQFLAGRLESAPKELRDAAIQDTVSSWLFRLIQSGKINSSFAWAPVGVLPQELLPELAAKSRVLVFDTSAAAAQAAQKLKPEDYAVVQRLIDAGNPERRGPGTLAYTGRVGDDEWRLVIRHEAGARSPHLVSLERVSPRTAPAPAAPFARRPTVDGRRFTFDSEARVGITHPAEFWRDENGERWLFKPVKDGEEFIPNGERAAYLLQRKLDPRAIQVETVELNGRFGSIQRWQEGLKLEADFSNTPIKKLTKDEIKALQREQVLDWLISNHDAHPRQFLRGADGHVWGIDKAQAWKYFPRDKLDIGYHPNAVYGEREPIYNTLWRAYAGKKVKLDINDTLDAARTLAAVSDDEFRQIVEPYAAARFKTETGREAFIKLATERKNRLADDFERFIVRQQEGPETGIETLREGLQTAEVAEKLVRHMRNNGAPDELTDHELEAIDLYSRFAHGRLNRLLRKNRSPGTITRLERENFAAANLLDDALSKLPPYQGKVYRGTHLPPELLAEYKPGSVVTEHAFVSTSTDKMSAFGGNVDFVIVSKTGRDISALSQHPDEQEVLFRTGTRFVVTGVEETTTTYMKLTTIKLEELDDLSLDALDGLIGP